MLNPSENKILTFILKAIYTNIIINKCINIYDNLYINPFASGTMSFAYTLKTKFPSRASSGNCVTNAKVGSKRRPSWVTNMGPSISLTTIFVLNLLPLK